jgi:hypothetical protein
MANSMSNRDLDATWKYHNGTKHSYMSVRVHPHFLDWENKPLLFKIYPTLEVMRLPKDFRQTGVAALSAIANPGIQTQGEKIPSLEDLAQFIFFCAGVTKSKKIPGGETFFRAAACTGALYEIELYIVCQDLPGLASITLELRNSDYVNSAPATIGGTSSSRQRSTHPWRTRP